MPSQTEYSPLPSLITIGGTSRPWFSIDPFNFLSLIEEERYKLRLTAGSWFAGFAGLTIPAGNGAISS